MDSKECKYHPENDPRLTDRHNWYNRETVANDPEYIFRLAEKMETDPKIRAIVHKKFRDGDLSFLMHDGQLKIYNMIKENPEAEEFLVLCSRQLGKSFITLLIAIEHLSKPYGMRNPMVRIFCETEAQIRDIIQDNMQVIEPLMPPGFFKRTKSEKRYAIGCGELRLGILAGAHVDGKRGGNATLVITEESGFSPSESFKDAVNNVISPQLLRSGGQIIHVTTSSKDELHFVHDVVQLRCEDNGTLANLTIYDNPQLSDKQIIKAFNKIFDGTPENWQREYLCMVIRSTILTVVPEFSESVVATLEMPTHAYWGSVVDFGGTRDKHGLLIGYHDFNEHVDVIIDEQLLPINTGTHDIQKHIETLEKHMENKNVVGHTRKIDATGQLLVDLRSNGFPCSLPSKAAGSFEAGVNQIRMAFVNNSLRIHPRCVNLIKCLKYGKLNKNRTDFERHLEFGHLDIVAALMYFLRHINRTNPFPTHYGLVRASSYLRPSEESKKIEKMLLNL